MLDDQTNKQDVIINNEPNSPLGVALSLTKLIIGDNFKIDVQKEREKIVISIFEKCIKTVNKHIKEK